METCASHDSSENPAMSLPEQRILPLSGSQNFAASWALLALPQNQPNAPLYPAGGAPGSRPGALPHFGRPRYLGPPPRARSTAG